MNLNRCIESFLLGVALVLTLLSENEDVPRVPRFSCKAVDDAWRQYRTGFDMEANPRIMKIFNNNRHTYSDLKKACE